jgi:threonine dehydrogenase-like Zn-dependent dehydrogenase
VPQAQFGPIKVPEGPPDDRFLYLSDVLPTAWQAIEFANIPEATHRLPLDEAPQAYEKFQKKQDGAFKVVFNP